MNNEEKLKPCPFCGGEAEMYSEVDRIMGKFWYIRCRKCYSNGSRIYESLKKLEPQEEYAAITGAWERAIEAWNRRTNDEQL